MATKDNFQEINKVGIELGKLICQKFGWPEEAVRSEWTATGDQEEVKVEFGLLAYMTQQEFEELLEQARENTYQGN